MEVGEVLGGCDGFRDAAEAAVVDSGCFGGVVGEFGEDFGLGYELVRMRFYGLRHHSEVYVREEGRRHVYDATMGSELVFTMKCRFSVIRHYNMGISEEADVRSSYVDCPKRM
ncbi:hypothetical protein Tco_0675717 [Tanacetum coccineum]